MDAAGASITLGYAAVNDENATQDVDMENMGIKVVSGDISLIISQGGYEALMKTEKTKVDLFLTKCLMV